MTTNSEAPARPEVRPKEVFVAGPFFALVDPATSRTSDSDTAKYTRLIEYFESKGAVVYNAHRREEWGAKFLPASEATYRDFNEISRSDLFIAFPGVPASPGTHVEIGWASALGKPMILMLERNAKHAFLVTGLETIANVEFIHFDSADEIFGQLDAAVVKVLANCGAASGAGQ